MSAPCTPAEAAHTTAHTSESATLTWDAAGANDDGVERLMAVLVPPHTEVLTEEVFRGKTERSSRHQLGMTLHKADAAAPDRYSGPPPDVLAWRRCRLLEAGFSAALAAHVAADPRFDLHALLQLIDRGCPPELAARIIEPVSEDTSWRP